MRENLSIDRDDFDLIPVFADVGGLGVMPQGVRRGETRQPTPRSQRGHRRMSDIVQKLWGFCHTLRHDGIDYGDYIEQITYLLFLKMADERGIRRAREGRDDGVPGRLSKRRAARTLTEHYTDVLRVLGKSSRHPRRHLLRGAVALQQPREPEETGIDDRRDRLDSPRRGRKGGSVRGLAGESGCRGQEGRGTVLHPAHPDSERSSGASSRTCAASPTSRSATPRSAAAGSSYAPTSGSGTRQRASATARRRSASGRRRTSARTSSRVRVGSR